MLAFTLFLALLPPFLFLHHFYSGLDPVELSVFSSIVVYATLIISTTYLHHLGRGSKETLVDLDVVSASPIAQAPTCSVYKSSLMRRFSPARTYLLATIPTCPSRAIYPKFEWAPVSIAISPFVLPTCKVNDGPAVPANFNITTLVRYHSKYSSNATFLFGVAVLTLAFGICLVGLEAASWSGEIDERHLAKLRLMRNLSSGHLPTTLAPKQTQEPTAVNARIEAAHAGAGYGYRIILPDDSLRPPELYVPALKAPLGIQTEYRPTAKHSRWRMAKCRRVGGKRVAQARPLRSTLSLPARMTARF